MTLFDENESFELSDYDPSWPQRFEEESALISYNFV